MVHAGLHPQWTIDEAMNWPRRWRRLAGSDYRTFLQQLFPWSDPQWDPALKGIGTPGQYRACVHATQNLT